MPSEITAAVDLRDYPLGTAARLRVVRGSTTEFPLAQRVRGGWQTGVHHYPDEQVTGVLEIYRPDRPAQPTVQPSVADIAQTIYDCLPRMTISRELAESIATKVAETIGGRTEAEVRAEALEEAATSLEGRLGVEGTPGTLYEYRAWLRARAAAIRAGGQ